MQATMVQILEVSAPASFGHNERGDEQPSARLRPQIIDDSDVAAP